MHADRDMSPFAHASAQCILCRLHLVKLQSRRDGPRTRSLSLSLSLYYIYIYIYIIERERERERACPRTVSATLQLYQVQSA